MSTRFKKVLAYITRDTGGRRQLLVFTHRDHPDAGVQVPAGTVKGGEDLQAALLREVVEETGLSDLRLITMLGTYDYRHPTTGNIHERHIFHLEAPAHLPDRWEWLETGGGEVSDQEGFVFLFYWADLGGDINLAGNQGDYLGALH